MGGKRKEGGGDSLEPTMSGLDRLIRDKVAAPTLQVGAGGGVVGEVGWEETSASTSPIGAGISENIPMN